MKRILFKVRKEEDMDWDPIDMYGGLDFLCSIKFFYGGRLITSTGREYFGGRISIIDWVDVEDINLDLLKKMVMYLGKGGCYTGDETLIFHYLIPGKSMMSGLVMLTSDTVLKEMVGHLTEHKCVDVYVEESGRSNNLGTEKEMSNVHGLEDIDIHAERERFSGVGSKYSVVGSPEGPNEVVNGDIEDTVYEDVEDTDYEALGDWNMGDDLDMALFETNVDPDVEWYDRANKDSRGKEKVNEIDLEELEVLRCEDLSSDDIDEEVGGRGIRRKLKVRHPRFNRAKDGEAPVFAVCQEFATKKELKTCIKLHSIQTRRDLKVTKNDKTRLRAICRGRVPGSSELPNESDSNSQSTEEATDVETGEVKMKCPWTLHASRLKGTTTWQIKTFVDTHWCLQTRRVRACTSRFLAKGLTETLRTNPQIPLGSLKNDLEIKYELNVSRSKAFRAKMEAHNLLVGSFTEQYALLRDYCIELQRANPGTTMKIEVEPNPNPDVDTRVFKRIYCCLGPMKAGFKAGCRPLLGLDGTFMKGPFPGQLLTAVGTDANNGIYPLAYAIVEAENMRSWEWFLECLGDDLGLTDRSNFCFISDRQKGLIPALAKLYPAAEHRYCLKHIWENFKLVHKGLVYKDLLWSAATATNIRHFDKAMCELKKVDQKAWEWLKGIPPQHWSKSHFSLFPKSDLLYNNLCETFNSKLVEARDKPIITCLEGVREYMMRRIVLVQKAIEKCHSILCPNIQEQFDTIKKYASQLRPSWNGGTKYQISGLFGEQFVVDLELRSCTCRKWDVSAIPCKHAVRAIWANAENGGDGVPENWVDDCYKLSTWKQVYSHKINPINGVSMWVHQENLTTILPPKHHTQPGRPKKARRKSKEEIATQFRPSMAPGDTKQSGKKPLGGNSVTCAKCGNRGHNQRTCKGQGDRVGNRSNKKARFDGHPMVSSSATEVLSNSSRMQLNEARVDYFEDLTPDPTSIYIPPCSSSAPVNKIHHVRGGMFTMNPRSNKKT